MLELIEAAVLRRETIRAWVRYHRDVRRARRQAACVAAVVERRRGARLSTWRPWLSVRYRAPAIVRRAGPGCRDFRAGDWRVARLAALRRRARDELVLPWLVSPG